MEEFKSNWKKIEEKKKEWLNFYKDNDQYKNVNIRIHCRNDIFPKFGLYF